MPETPGDAEPAVTGDSPAYADEVTPEELLHPESLVVHEPTGAGDDRDGLWTPARRPLTLGLVLTITLVAAESLAVVTAMPIVARELNGFQEYGLVFSAFMLGQLVGIVLAGSLIDRRGVVVPFVIGLAVFATGLLLAGAAQSMPMLVAARLIQGIGGGAIPPIAYVAIGRSLPARLRPRMFATLSTAWILPGVLGPGIAGIVAEALNWRWIFFGLLPVLAVAGWLAYRGLRALPALPATSRGAATGSRIRDGLIVGVGVAILTGAMAADSPVVLVALGVPSAAATAWAFVRLVPPGTIRGARGYPTAVLLRGVLTFAFFTIDAYVALLLVEVRGWSAVQAGIAVTAATLSWTAGSWTQARLAARFRHEWFVRIGFPVVAIGIAGLAPVLSTGVPAALGVLAFAVAGYGMGLTYAQFAMIVLRDVPHESQGEITSGLTLSDALGTVLGTSVTAALVSAGIRAGLGPGPGLAAAIAIGVGGAILGWFLAPRLHAEPTRVSAGEAADRLR